MYSEEEIADPDLFAENVRQIAASELGVPTTEHSYEDSFLSMAARKNKANPKHILQFEFAALNELFKIDLKEGKRLMKLFISDPKAKKTGTINVEQFAKALGGKFKMTSTVAPLSYACFSTVVISNCGVLLSIGSFWQGRNRF